jgi:maleylpyruvate isomerase
MDLQLHGYFRSGTTYRVRLALIWKHLDYATIPVNLLKAEHSGAEFKTINPQGLVPALQVGDDVLSQSTAILEWIEETYPDRPLLPQDPIDRAKLRAFCAVIGCDIHPIQNLRVMKKVRGDYNVEQDDAFAWARHWIELGFDALEKLSADLPGENGFIFGDTPSLGEIYLIPQMYNARRFGVDLTPFPRLVAADAAANALEEFQRARPENQPDAPAQ